MLAFGLDYRPLHNDEGVTLHVASEPSVRDVLHTAIDYRHGPPLHYLLVHVSLLWHDDVLGLRLPSALLGILAVALAYWLGRELLGPPGGALVSVDHRDLARGRQPRRSSPAATRPCWPPATAASGSCW